MNLIKLLMKTFMNLIDLLSWRSFPNFINDHLTSELSKEEVLGNDQYHSTLTLVSSIVFVDNNNARNGQPTQHSLASAQSPSCTREKGSGQKGHLEVRILWPSQVVELWSHDISNYVWFILTCVRSAYAYGTEVAVSFYFMHTRIANNYCIPARRVSVTLLTRPFLSFCVGGAGTREYTQQGGGGWGVGGGGRWWTYIWCGLGYSLFT